MKKIKLTRNMEALVDDEDYLIVSQYKWFAVNLRGDLYHAATYINQKLTLMSELLFSGTNMLRIHKNNNGLDNRRVNILLGNASQRNQAHRKYKNNKCGYKGVWFDKSHNKFRAEIRVDKRKICIGSFDNVIEAAIAYDDCAIKYFKEFANLNFPERYLATNNIALVKRPTFFERFLSLINRIKSLFQF